MALTHPYATMCKRYLIRRLTTRRDGCGFFAAAHQQPRRHSAARTPSEDEAEDIPLADCRDREPANDSVGNLRGLAWLPRHARFFENASVGGEDSTPQVHQDCVLSSLPIAARQGGVPMLARGFDSIPDVTTRA